MKCFAQFSLAALLLAAFCVGTTRHAQAQDSQSPIPMVKLVDFEQTSIREVLRKLFADVNKSYSIAPEVQGDISVSMKNTPLESALHDILKCVDATYHVESGVYMITANIPSDASTRAQGYAQTAPAYESQNVGQQSVKEVEYVQVDAREAIRKLCRDVSAAYTIAPDVQGVITMSLRNVTFETALQNILRQVDATYRVQAGVYEIIRKDTNPDVPHVMFTPDEGLSTRLMTTTAPSAMVVDGRYLYVLRGTDVFKFDKNDLKLLKTGSLNDWPALPKGKH